MVLESWTTHHESRIISHQTEDQTLDYPKRRRLNKNMNICPACEQCEGAKVQYITQHITVYTVQDSPAAVQ